jgi:3-dehydroquinate synthase
MIFLTGFMGAGKTTAGTRLAERLGYTFVDLDSYISSSTGGSIKDIFRVAGESAFRFLERRALLEVAAMGQSIVVATGGGVPLDPLNRAVMKAAGIVFYLETSFDTLTRRIPEDPERPLWGEDARDLLEKRRPFYEEADFTVTTDGMGVQDTVDKILTMSEGAPRQVPVLVPKAPYPVYIGKGIMQDFRRLLGRHARPEGLFVVADERVMSLHEPFIRSSMPKIPCTFMTVPQGEETKSMSVLSSVLDAMADAGVNRQWACVAVGGGVTGDLAAFASSVFMRGIPVIHVPTTLLAQVDSSIGGKTAVDLAGGKNLAGTFHQPLAVISDTDFLATLDASLIQDAMAEVVKYAIVMDRGLFEYLEEASELDFQKVVAMCATDKASVVSRDEREGGLRRILNFGHTLGHALEHAQGYRTSHGSVVEAGMHFSIWLSQRLELVDEKTATRMRRLIQKWTHPFTDLAYSDPLAIEQAISSDKKSSLDGIHFVLTCGIGDGTVKKLSRSQILGAYGRFFGESSEGL